MVEGNKGLKRVSYTVEDVPLYRRLAKERWYLPETKGKQRYKPNNMLENQVNISVLNCSNKQ